MHLVSSTEVFSSIDFAQSVSWSLNSEWIGEESTMAKSKKATKQVFLSLIMSVGFMAVYLVAHNAKAQQKQTTINADHHGSRLILIRESMRR